MGICLEFFGSRDTTIFALSLTLIKWAFEIFANYSICFKIAMFLSGVVESMAYISFPIYIGEISPVEMRGSLIAYGASGAPVGMIVLAFYKVALDAPKASVINICICSLAISMFVRLKNSPYHLVAIGELKEAESSISFYFPLEDVARKLSEIKTLVAKSETETNLTLGERLKRRIQELTKRSTRKTVFIIFLLFAWSRVSCTTTTFKTLMDHESRRSNLFGWEKSVMGIISISTACFFLVLSFQNFDKLGRKMGFLCPSFGTSVNMMLLGTFYYFEGAGFDLTRWQWCPLVGIQFCTICLFIGYYTVPLMVLSELPPSSTKCFSACVASFAITLSFDYISKHLFNLITSEAGITYACWCNGVISMFGVPIALFLVPETKMKNFIEIQTLILKNS